MSWQSIATEFRTAVLEPIKQSLVGKNEIIEVLGVAMVAGENAFLLGPPGTAKSALVDELANRLKGQSFDYLLTRFTEPSELFGPFDLRKLRDGDLVTNTEGMLPEADFVFLDELLNANSAILNSLLLALNERVFRRGREKLPLPMLLAVGASNHLPEDEALAALFDRFMLRIQCDNVDDEQLQHVLSAGWKREQRGDFEPAMSVEAVRKLQRATTTIDLGPVMKAYLDLVKRLRRAGIPISDRRAVRLQRVIAASAVLCGRDFAAVSDLWTLAYIWDAPTQSEILESHITAIRQEYEKSSLDQPDDRSPNHPMADRDRPPDPESISKELDAIDGGKWDTIAQDKLALLAARIEFIPSDTARDHLRQRVASIRNRETAAAQ